MKYWNKHPYTRETWTKVMGTDFWSGEQAAKVWCQRQTSGSRFYYRGNAWYFEKESDAIWFTLRWANKPK